MSPPMSGPCGAHGLCRKSARSQGTVLAPGSLGGHWQGQPDATRYLTCRPLMKGGGVAR
jgi:hypothetical protein